MGQYNIVVASSDHKIEVGDIVRNRTYVKTVSGVSYSKCLVFRKVSNNKYHYLGILKYCTDEVVVSDQSININGMIFDFDCKKATELLNK